MIDYSYAKIETFRHQDQVLIATNPLRFEPIGIALAGNAPLMWNFLDKPDRHRAQHRGAGPYGQTLVSRTLPG